MKFSLKIKYILSLFIIIVVIISVILSFFKYSKSIYADSDSFKFQASSSGLYISSDFIGGYYELLNYDTNNIEFNIYNYESDTQISSMDLAYDLSCNAPAGYECYIDGQLGGVSNQVIQKNYTCSVPNLSESECKNSSSATITYNKNYKTHNIRVKSASGSISTGSSKVVTVNLNLLRPYRGYPKNYHTVLVITFDDEKQGVVVETMDSYENKCVYRITNYSETGRFHIYSNNGTLEVNYLGGIFTTLEQYVPLNNFVVYRPDSSYSCDNLITVTRSN